MHVYALWLLISTLLLVGGGAGTALAQAVLNEEFCVGFLPTGTMPNSTPGVPTHGEIGQWNGNGQPLIKVELNEPGAVCNDGSPGTMYLRPAPMTVAGAPNPSANRWVIHFKGGGGCRSFAACRARWCAHPSKNLNNPGLMSTAGTFLRANGKGILSQDPDNPFRSWNHVLLYYCSSDNWIGDHDMGMAVSYHPDDAAGLHDHQIAFKGMAIVKAAIGRLLSSVPVTLPASGNTQMPLLQNADLVLLSGDSAGAVGARMHADRLAEELRAANTPLGSNLPVLLTLDAGAAPLYDGGVLPWNPTAFASYDLWWDILARDQRDFRGVRLSNLDQSCVDQTADPDTCYDDRYVQLNHITTPMFQRNDLFDPVGKDSFISLGLVATESQYTNATAQDLLAIVPPGIEGRDNISVFGPLCKKHVSIRNTCRFTQEVAISGGLTYAQALGQWVQGCVTGVCPSISEVTAPVPPSNSTCPPVPATPCP